MKSKEISLDQIALISDPNHYAVYALMGLKQFKSDTEWIARRLALSSLQVRLILERLEKLGLISKVGRKYIPQHELLHSREVIPSQALKKRS